MYDDVDKAIKTLVGKISTQDMTGDDALKFTQAALNLAKTYESRLMVGIEQERRSLLDNKD